MKNTSINSITPAAGVTNTDISDKCNILSDEECDELLHYYAKKSGCNYEKISNDLLSRRNLDTYDIKISNAAQLYAYLEREKRKESRFNGTDYPEDRKLDPLTDKKFNEFVDGKKFNKLVHRIAKNTELDPGIVQKDLIKGSVHLHIPFSRMTAQLANYRAAIAK